jgi:hypothetical protein
MSQKAPGEWADRDAELEALYRSLPRATPQSGLDDAIRAAARRAIGARPRAAVFSRRWGFPVAVAAVLVLSVTLAVLVREEAPPELVELRHAHPPQTPESPVADEPPAPGRQLEAQPDMATSKPRAGDGDARRPPSPAVPERSKAEPSMPATGASSEPQAAKAAKENVPAEVMSPAPASIPPRATANEVPAAQAPVQRRFEEPEVRGRASPAPSPSAPSAATQSMRSQERLDAAKDVRETRDAQAPVVREKAEARSPGAMNKAEEPPEKWLADIDDLRRQGRLEEARKRLSEFVNRHPDYPVPHALRDALRP